MTNYFDLNAEAKQELTKIDSYDFNIFTLRKQTNGNELKVLLPFILNKRGLIGATPLNFNRLLSFCGALQSGYKNITYHNKTHASDLCQTFNYFMVKGNLQEKMQMDNVEIISCLVAAMMHDYEHPGVNNPFLININDPKAIRHNDVSVLENHHLAASFELMIQNDENNWAHQFDKADFKRIREIIIKTVLATDMAQHFSELGILNGRVPARDFDPKTGKDKSLMMKFIFHMSDISNPTKNFDVCRLWCDLLFVEFFAQGDLEAEYGFDISQFYDRKTTNIAKSQIGFIDIIIKPAYIAVIKAVPELGHLENAIEDNKKCWTGLFDEYEKKKEEGN